MFRIDPRPHPVGTASPSDDGVFLARPRFSRLASWVLAHAEEAAVADTEKPPVCGQAA
jgi:hypothetical protein